MANRLCQKCQRHLDEFATYLDVVDVVQFNRCSEIQRGVPERKHHETITSLKSAAAKGCCLCILFLGHLNDDIKSGYAALFPQTPSRNLDKINATLSTRTDDPNQNWILIFQTGSSLYDTGTETRRYITLDLYPADPIVEIRRFFFEYDSITVRIWHK
jgi:hypothetical protein